MIRSWSVQQDSEDLDRLRDVLDLLCAQIFEDRIDLSFDLVVDVASDADAARIGQGLQARCNVHPVAVNVFTLDNDVADVDSDTVGNELVFWDIGVAQLGAIVPREDILDKVWGYEVFPSTRTIDIFIVRLRRKPKGCWGLQQSGDRLYVKGQI